MSILSGISLAIVWWLEQQFGTVTLAAYDSLILGSIFLIVIVSVLGGDRLWLRIFIQSGYLNDAATIRLMSNRAPTGRGERVHRWFGPLLLLAIYGALSFAGVMARQWWMLFLALPLLVWGLLLMHTARKQADEMLAGGPIPPESEERIQQIEQVLETRRRKARN